MKVTKHEHLRYFVESQSGAEPYLVDLLVNECPCTDCQVRVKAEKIKPYCKHIEAAIFTFGLDVLGQIREQTKTKRE
jgi:hypothetical protein